MINNLTEKEQTELIIMKHLEQNLTRVCDVTELTEEEYALMRRGSLGASDSSIICDVNLYKNKEQLLAEKQSTIITDDEKAIGLKPAVRMGKELEPLVLTKFTLATGINLVKPPYMYRHKEFEYLTMNYDGVAFTDSIITVEAKIVTKYGEKYYKKEMALNTDVKVVRNTNNKMKDHILEMAAKCGIPAYYYTQVQQQIMGLDSPEKESPYGYLAVLFIDSWDFKYFYIPRDPYTIAYIIAEGSKFKNRM